MKKIVKYICLFIAIVMLVTTLCSCDRAPGLYNWLGIRINVDYMLRLVLDMGNGEIEYLVPFDLYRDLFTYYKTKVSDLVPVDENSTNAKLATAQEQTAALKEYTEDQLMEYYSLLSICDFYGIGIGDDNGELYQQEYERQVKAFAETLTDEDIKDFKGTKLEYANKLYEDNIKNNLGMTLEYFKYNFYRSLLIKRLKMHLIPNLEDYISQSYYHFNEIYIEYTIGDSVSEEESYKKINEAYEKLQKGESFEDLMEEYNNNVLYKSDIYADSYNNIVGSSTNSTLTSVIAELINSLTTNEYSEIVSGDADEETGYFAIIQRLGFDDDIIFGSTTVSDTLFMYPYYGATSYSSYYTQYADLLDAYEQNMRIEVYDQSIYNKVSIKTLY